MKKNSLLFGLIALTNILFSQEYNNYNLESVKNILQENNEIPLRFDFTVDVPNGPRGLAFNSNGILYISDPVSNRLISWDSKSNEFEEINTLPYDALISGSSFIREGQFININGYQVISIDLESQSVSYIISLNKSSYNKSLVKSGNDDFIFYGNLVFSFLTDNRLITIAEPVESIEENNQNILNPEETLELIKTEFADEIQLIESNHILINEELQTRDFMRFFSYWNDIYKGDRDKLTLTGKLYADPSASQMRFIGKDREGNWYWKFGSKAIVVHNAQGQVIENFIYDSKKSKTLPAVHPSGDVYFLDYDEEGIYINKISRRW